MLKVSYRIQQKHQSVRLKAKISPTQTKINIQIVQ